jgi:hypothetical protein
MNEEERRKYKIILDADARDIVNRFHKDERYLKSLISKYSKGQINPDSFDYSELLHHGYYLRGKAQKMLKELKERKEEKPAPKKKKETLDEQLKLFR